MLLAMYCFVTVLCVCAQKTKDAKSCMQEEECEKFRNTYFLCKRSQIDMRARIRGNKGY